MLSWKKKTQSECFAVQTLNLGCGPDNWGDVRVDIGYYTQTGVRTRLNVRADAHHLPFRDGVFDFGRCWHMLEHVKNPHAVVREIRRVCRKAELRFPRDDKREFLNYWPFPNYYATRTYNLHAHLWKIHPGKLTGPLTYRSGDKEILLFLRLGKKRRFFNRFPLPKIKSEWIVQL